MNRGLLLKNYSTGVTLVDTLHEQEPDAQNNCTEKRCLGSMVLMPGYAKPSRPLDEVESMAKEFFYSFFAATDSLNGPAHTKRWGEVQQHIASTGTYELTEEELFFGAKMAWRNASRCIGRIQWNNLKMFDARHVETTREMFDAICNHITYATNNGNIRSTITVFPKRREGRGDFRVWNSQLIGYAGYKMDDGTVIGDPINVELTKVCKRLGWKGKMQRWEILPMVLSNGIDGPDFFVLPPEIVMEVRLSHPTYKWFAELGLRWYALPAVSNMLFDVGGLQFPATPFNGWYMVTEISCRDLCDAQRLDVLELVAAEMGEDTSSHTTLWKDRVMLEVNIAVLHSFQQERVTIVDHHTASESFVKHLFNEQKARNGCPADWVWIVPPMSGSLTSVFHQEMALYLLKPSFEYQEAAWLTHDWGEKKAGQRPRYSLRQVSRVVQATVRMFGSALKRRVHITVLYATETGRSEMFARKVADVFLNGFNPKIICMEDYNFDDLPHESLVIVVASTFQNGDGPQNGLNFAGKLSAGINDDETVITEPPTPTTQNSDVLQLGTIKEFEGILKNVRFSVFALGSSVYPHFCAFGHLMDNLLGKLGGQRLLAVKEADEMSGQEKCFESWITELYQQVCKSFNVVAEEHLVRSLSMDEAALTAGVVRFVQVHGQLLEVALAKTYKKQVEVGSVIRKTILNDEEESGNIVFLLEYSSEEEYEPGDHVGIFPANRPELVNGILKLLKCSIHPNQPVRLQIQDERKIQGGIATTWVPYPNIPPCSLKILLSRFLDITTPLHSSQLQKLSAYVLDPKQKHKMIELATNPVKYEHWRNLHYPHLLEVMEQFPSLTIPPPLLVTILHPLQPRFYSISSSPNVHPGQIHLTTTVIKYKTRRGSGPEHYGVCSNHLYNASTGDTLYAFVRKCNSFSLPKDLTKPVIMVGPGTGVAPFRAFWEQRMFDIQCTQKQPSKNQRAARSQGELEGEIIGMWLFFGCRTESMNIYRKEKEKAVKSGALEKTFLALSRDPNIPKTYVQHLLQREGAEVFRKLNDQGGHLFICGDVAMADGVSQTLVAIAQTHGHMDERGAQRFMKQLKTEKRFHEDVFGLLHMTPQIQKISETRRSIDAGTRSRDSSFIRRWFC